MNLPTEKELEFYDKNNVARPTHDGHSVRDSFENPLSEQLKSGNPRNWRLEGNLLHCDTDFGPMAQRIPADYVCMGTDDKGLPILKKVVLST